MLPAILAGAIGAVTTSTALGILEETPDFAEAFTDDLLSSIEAAASTNAMKGLSETELLSLAELTEPELP